MFRYLYLKNKLTNIYILLLILLQYQIYKTPSHFSEVFVIFKLTSEQPLYVCYYVSALLDYNKELILNLKLLVHV